MKLIFVWDNFGPIHADRCEAVAERYEGVHDVLGIELYATSNIYDWESEHRNNFTKITVSKIHHVNPIDKLYAYFRLIKLLIGNLGGKFFFCHYERPSIFLAAILLRMFWQDVYVMNDSKFDDYKRILLREIIKFIFYLPYKGALSSGTRSKDYLRFLGIKENKIETHYNSLSLNRIRRLAGKVENSEITFDERYFLIVARFVPKKNLFVALDAMQIFLHNTNNARRLLLIGSGPLDNELRNYCVELGISDKVDFLGFLQIDKVSMYIKNSLALLLVSTEEQFGNVVIEALALEIPCIVSTQCGVRDVLIRSGQNGFIVEPDNPEGISFFMELISGDINLWQRLSARSAQYAHFGDCSVFGEAVDNLIN